MLCLGSSLNVTPAADIPFEGDATVVVVSLQRTGRDVQALQTGGILIHQDCNQVMEALVAKLGLDFPNSKEAADAYAEEFAEQVCTVYCGVRALTCFQVTRERDEAEAKEAASEPPAPKPQSNFFHDLGLPSTLTQLPSFIAVTQTNGTGADGQATWSLELVAPENYPLALTEFVDKVTFSRDGTELAVCEKEPFQSGTQSHDGPSTVNVSIEFGPGYGEASEVHAMIRWLLTARSDHSLWNIP